MSQADEVVNDERGPVGRSWSSLCEDCAHVRAIASAKGSTFLLCQRSKADARFTKYPPQPVVSCTGFERYARA